MLDLRGADQLLRLIIGPLPLALAASESFPMEQ
jgi:hypothetical protein